MPPTMLRPMLTRNHLHRYKLPLQLAAVIIIKIAILLVLWHVLLKEHKMQGHAEATAAYFLNPTAKPQKQTIPRSPWE